MNKIEKLERLIEKGNEVLKTHKSNPPGVFGFPTLDSATFAGWKTQCLNFLENTLSNDSSYFVNFKKNLNWGIPKQ